MLKFLGRKSTNIEISGVENYQILKFLGRKLSNIEISGSRIVKFLGRKSTNIEISGSKIIKCWNFWVENYQMLKFLGRKSTNIEISGVKNHLILKFLGPEPRNVEISGSKTIKYWNFWGRKLWNIEITGSKIIKYWNFWVENFSNIEISGSRIIKYWNFWVENQQILNFLGSKIIKYWNFWVENYQILKFLGRELSNVEISVADQQMRDPKNYQTQLPKHLGIATNDNVLQHTKCENLWIFIHHGSIALSTDIFLQRPQIDKTWKFLNQKLTIATRTQHDIRRINKCATQKTIKLSYRNIWESRRTHKIIHIVDRQTHNTHLTIALLAAVPNATLLSAAWDSSHISSSRSTSQNSERGNNGFNNCALLPASNQNIELSHMPLLWNFGAVATKSQHDTHQSRSQISNWGIPSSSTT